MNCPSGAVEPWQGVFLNQKHIIISPENRDVTLISLGFLDWQCSRVSVLCCTIARPTLWSRLIKTCGEKWEQVPSCRETQWIVGLKRPWPWTFMNFGSPKSAAPGLKTAAFIAWITFIQRTLRWVHGGLVCSIPEGGHGGHGLVVYHCFDSLIMSNLFHINQLHVLISINVPFISPQSPWNPMNLTWHAHFHMDLHCFLAQAPFQNLPHTVRSHSDRHGPWFLLWDWKITGTCGEEVLK